MPQPLEMWILLSLFLRRWAAAKLNRQTTTTTTTKYNSLLSVFKCLFVVCVVEEMDYFQVQLYLLENVVCNTEAKLDCPFEFQCEHNICLFISIEHRHVQIGCRRTAITFNASATHFRFNSIWLPRWLTVDGFPLPPAKKTLFDSLFGNKFICSIRRSFRRHIIRFI